MERLERKGGEEKIGVSRRWEKKSRWEKEDERWKNRRVEGEGEEEGKRDKESRN